MNIISFVILDAAPANGGGEGSYMGILMIVAMIAIFYFFMIRPQQKRQKDIQRAREAMKVGDRIVTAGGIHGKVKEIAEKYMLIEISEGVRIRVDRASVFASAEDIQTKS
ncbi:MAG: preprotein translocase subunit YajC [Tannerella sp.]|nr:preprotein translocase subunit YajC [Tannerella sp.]